MEWNIDAPQNVVDDLDTLFRDAVDAAANTLADSAAFTPFMLVIDRPGGKAMRASGRSAGTDELTITRMLQRDGDNAALRARVTVFDVTVSAPFRGDATEVAFEHSTGLAVDLLVPYTVTSDSLEINLDGTDAVTGIGRLWA